MLWSSKELWLKGVIKNLPNPERHLDLKPWIGGVWLQLKIQKEYIYKQGPERKAYWKKRFVRMFKSRYSKNFIGIGLLHGCLQTHACSVLSRPHPPPHSNRSCKSRSSFLGESSSHTKESFPQSVKVFGG